MSETVALEGDEYMVKNTTSKSQAVQLDENPDDCFW